MMKLECMLGTLLLSGGIRVASKGSLSALGIAKSM